MSGGLLLPSDTSPPPSLSTRMPFVNCRVCPFRHTPSQIGVQLYRLNIHIQQYIFFLFSICCLLLPPVNNLEIFHYKHTPTTFFFDSYIVFQTSLVAQLVKNPPAMRETWVWSLGWEDPLEKGKVTHSSILAWRIPWTVKSLGLQRVGHIWATYTFTFCIVIGTLYLTFSLLMDI